MPNLRKSHAFAWWLAALLALLVLGLLTLVVGCVQDVPMFTV